MRKKVIRRKSKNNRGISTKGKATKEKSVKKTVAISAVKYTDFEHLNDKTKESIKRLVDRTKGLRRLRYTVSKLKRTTNDDDFSRMLPLTETFVLQHYLKSISKDYRFSDRKDMVIKVLKARGEPLDL